MRLWKQQQPHRSLSLADMSTVCVTGGSGCIGSWLVRLLLLRGYSVHATVQNIKDEQETKHLEDLEGADARLRLFQIDLLDYGSIVSAVSGCAGVFHLASPCIVDRVEDPERELLEPAIRGTINVLTAAKEAGVQRVVVTSSVTAIVLNPSWPADVPINEDCWTDVHYCRQNGLWYPLSKTLAEKAAWDFGKEKGLDVVVINPGTVLGPVIPPTINASMKILLRLLQGETFKDFFVGIVHFKDVALAHILVYENKSAAGRHLCVANICPYPEFVAMVAQLYPQYKVPRSINDKEFGSVKARDGAKKLMDLGLNFIPMEETIKDAVEELKKMINFLNLNQ